MSARLLLNLGLLVLSIALGWYAFRIDAPPPPFPGPPLTTLSIDDIKTIHIVRDGNTIAQLQRSAHEWRLRKPIDTTADSFRVQTLLAFARAHSTTGFRASGNDLAQYGLQPARASVRFNTTTLLIGDTDPIAGHRYVMVSEQVHLIEDKWFAQIFGSATAWFDPRLLPHAMTMLRIDLRSSAQQVQSNTNGRTNGTARGAALAQWQRVGKQWQRTPEDVSANAQQTERRGAALAKAWRQARALSVRPRNHTLQWSGQVTIGLTTPPSSQLATAHQRANVDVEQVTTIIFKLARTADALFLAREDLDVQYRFLPRQGDALLGVSAAR
ncbi:MAG: hypothetical protein ACI8W7_004199 [Gammaproteobacteria bacterium]|jgi:hypothetical protein